jgi:molybdate transport system substrate-binding protein
MLRAPRRRFTHGLCLSAIAAAAFTAGDVTAFAATPGAPAEAPVRVFAAASLTDALTAIARQWQRQGHPAPSLAFAASSTLARQIEAGAPVDLYASADAKWMDYVEDHHLIQTSSRRELLGTDLVLIAPTGAAPRVRMEKGFPITTAFSGKLCTGDTAAVPVGIYAKQALQSLGWWQPLQGRIVGTDDVRSALAFVERGECALGIVYATDARITDEVQIVARFPAATHTPVVYSFALVKDARPIAGAFYAMLQTPEATAIFERYGFEVRPQPHG